MIRACLIVFLMVSGVAHAEVHCNAEILQWRQLCLEAMPEEDCIIEDDCVLFDETDANEIIKDARIETPDDTPEGFREQIYIIP